MSRRPFGSFLGGQGEEDVGRSTGAFLSSSELQREFQKALWWVRTIPLRPEIPSAITMEVRLQFYALYKQAISGPCREPQPSFIDVVARKKWIAWNALGSMTKDDAMRTYLRLLEDTAGCGYKGVGEPSDDEPSSSDEEYSSDDGDKVDWSVWGSSSGASRASAPRYAHHGDGDDSRNVDDDDGAVTVDDGQQQQRHRIHHSPPHLPPSEPMLQKDTEPLVSIPSATSERHHTAVSKGVSPESTCTESGTAGVVLDSAREEIESLPIDGEHLGHVGRAHSGEIQGEDSSAPSSEEGHSSDVDEEPLVDALDEISDEDEPFYQTMDIDLCDDSTLRIQRLSESIAELRKSIERDSVTLVQLREHSAASSMEARGESSSNELPHILNETDRDLKEVVEQLESRFRHTQRARLRAEESLDSKLQDLQMLQEHTLATLDRIETSMRPWNWLYRFSTLTIPLAFFALLHSPLFEN